MAFFTQHLLHFQKGSNDLWTGMHGFSNTLAVGAAHTAWVTAAHTIWDTVGPSGQTYRAVCSVDTVLHEVVTYQLDPLTFRKQAFQSTTFDIAGTLAGTPAHDALALEVRLLASGELNRHAGMMKFPPPTASHLSTSSWDVGAVNAIGLALRDALTHMYPAGLQPSVYNRKTGQFTGITDHVVVDRAVFVRTRQPSRINRTTFHDFP